MFLRVRRHEQIPLAAAARREAIEAREMIARLSNGFRGNAGESRDLQAVTLVRGTVFDRMQEDDAVLVLDRVEVNVGAAVELRRQCRQLEVMGREQAQAPIAERELPGDRPRQR